MVNGVTNQTNTGSTGSTSSSNASKKTLGKDAFMKLMIQQMKNQDPMNPMDGTAFAAQLAQFSSLEQLQNLNNSMTQSINANYLLTQSINNTLSSTLIGKEVKLNGNDIVNNGQSSINLAYNLPSDAKSVSVNIYDQNGTLVKQINNLPTKNGEAKLSWDFTDNNGSKVANGNYTFKVEAKDYSGEELTVDSYKYGLISGVKFTNSGTKLMVDNAEYNLSDILEVVNPDAQGGN